MTHHIDILKLIHILKKFKKILFDEDKLDFLVVLFYILLLLEVHYINFNKFRI
jgi:hypothetical protein